MRIVRRLERLADKIVEILADLAIIALLLLWRFFVRIVPAALAALARFVLAILNTSAVSTAVVIVLLPPSLAATWYVFIPWLQRSPPGIVELLLVQPKNGPSKTQEQAGENLPEYLRIDDQLVWYAALAATDDMRHPDNRLEAAKVNVFIALERPARVRKEKDGKSYYELVADTRRVWQNYEALQVPGDAPFRWPRWEWWVTSREVASADVKTTAEQLRSFLKEHGQIVSDPMLPKRYLRDKKDAVPAVDEAAMRARMCRVSGRPGTAEFFRPKKTPDEKCP